MGAREHRPVRHQATFVPLADATESGDTLAVPFEKAVKDAPKVDADGQLSQQEESELYRHYGRDYPRCARTPGCPRATAPTATGTERDFDAGGTVATTRRGPTTDDAMTRSEEELRVGTTERETGRVRLRKYVVTEDVRRRSRSSARRSGSSASRSRTPTSAPRPRSRHLRGGHEVVLHAEEPVAEKRVVPKERVRLDKDQVTEERTVSEEVRSERIDVDDDTRRA